MSFNKYEFKDEIFEESKQTIIDNFNQGLTTDVNDEIFQRLDNFTIYTYNCWDIVNEFRPSNFVDSITGEYCKTIEQLAISCLYEYLIDEGIYNELEIIAEKYKDLQSKRDELESIISDLCDEIGKEETEQIINDILSQIF